MHHRNVIKTLKTESICTISNVPQGRYLVFRYTGDHISGELLCHWADVIDGDDKILFVDGALCTMWLDLRGAKDYVYQEAFDYDTMRKNLMHMIYMSGSPHETRREERQRMRYTNRILSIASLSNISLEMLMLCLYAAPELTEIPVVTTPFALHDNLMSWKIQTSSEEEMDSSIQRCLDVTRGNISVVDGEEATPNIVSKSTVTLYHPRDVVTRYVEETNTNICYTMTEVVEILKTGICPCTGEKVHQGDLDFFKEYYDYHPHPEHCVPLRDEVSAMTHPSLTVEQLL